MHTATYDRRRGQLETYFDRTAAEAWARLTSDAPVSRIRATVRAGRERMRLVLLDLLPLDLRGMRVLDAGCGTGAFANEAARRGAHVVAIDVAPKLVELALERKPTDLYPGSVEFRVGDMLDESLGRFDYVIAMDSLIHYLPGDVAEVLAQLAARTQRAVLFTFAPSNPALAAMHAVGRLFPRGDRAPSIEPVSEQALRRRLAQQPQLQDWRAARSMRVASGFYTSQAMELVRA
ncbi:MAG: magnesium protoporphyrin IX methyltransferase [Proteobacteria bacterium]|nr:magnesium protoporphyrin IX methyltransferase [Pseudomonadota bacterium]